MAGRHHLPRRRRRDHLGGGAHPRPPRRRGSRVVLPYGSRVATSRINFRLLAREALTHDKRLSIVAGDAATRALAASAGLPVFASVAEYEASRRPRGRATTGRRPARSAVRGRGQRAAAAAAAAGTSGAAGADARRPSRPASRGAAAATAPTGGRSPTARRGLVVPGGRRRRRDRRRAGAVAGDDVRAPVHGRRATSAAAGRAAPAARRRDRPTAAPRDRSRARTASARRAAASGRRGSSAARILALALLVGGVGAYLLLPSATIVGHAARPSRSGRSR